ncbi:MAG: hypothetical protein Q8O76_13535 [Chloroflexota bacterium]|nr:hypothetical protein [Chloroflexota bacterium]
MDLLMICRDALENSVMANLLLAMEAKKAGKESGVLFTQEALAALGGGAFAWSRLLADRDTRMTVAKKAKEKGIPVLSSRDSRETDLKPLLKAAKEAGVGLYACPTWSELLDLKGKLPPEVKEIDLPSSLKLISEAKRVIGSY